MILSRLRGVRPVGVRTRRDADDEKRITIICRLHDRIRECGCGGNVWAGNGARDVDEGQRRRTFLLGEEREMKLVAVIDSGPEDIPEKSADDGPFLWRTLSTSAFNEVCRRGCSLSAARSTTISLSVMVNLEAFEPWPRASEEEAMVDRGWQRESLCGRCV